MIKVTIFLLAFGAALCSPTSPVKKCAGMKEQLFKQVVISTPKGICTKLPCDLPRGMDVTTDITFEVKKPVEKITIKCNATSLGVTIEYPIPKASEGCDMLTNTFCPIEPDTEADLTFKMNVSKIFPKVPVDLVIYMLDQSKKMISCFEVSTRVVDDKLLLTED